MRLCEREDDEDYLMNRGVVNDESKKHQNYLNSLWLIAITFLSVNFLGIFFTIGS